LLPNHFQALFRRVDAAFELGVFGEGQHFFEARAGFVTGTDQIPAGDEERGADFFFGELFPSPFCEFVEREIAVTRGDVEAMQCEVFVEFRQAEEALEGRLFHLLDIAEAHVIFNEGENLGAVFVREAQAAQDFVRDLHADLDVAIEADAIRRFVRKGRGLADVVQERSPGERGGRAGWELFEKQEGMNPDVAFGVVLGRLGHVVQLRDFGQDLLEEAGAVEEFEGAAGVAFREHTGEFVADAFAADLIDGVSELADGALGFGIDGEVEARGKADGAEHAQLVFFKTAMRLADGADDAGAEIALAADVIENSGGEIAGLPVEHGVEHHAVDGEVTTENVFAGARGEAHLGGVAAVEVGYVRAKCSNLGDNFVTINIVADKNHTEVGADGEGAGKHGENRVWMGAGGYVEVLWGDAEEEISDAAAGEVSLVARCAELIDDALCRDLCRCFHCDFLVCPGSRGSG
jgi:hypothetical protein